MANANAQRIKGTANGKVAGGWPPGRFVSKPLQHALRFPHFNEGTSQIDPSDRSEISSQSLAIPHRQVMIPQDEVTSQRCSDPSKNFWNPIHGAGVIDPITRNHQAIRLVLLKPFECHAIEFNRNHTGQMEVRKMSDAQATPAKRQIGHC